MSSGGGRFDLRFDLLFFVRGPDVIAAGGLGDGSAPRRLALRDGVSTALSGGCPLLNVAERELERGGFALPGPSGEGLIVDEKGMYIAEGGMPVGVDVRSDPDPDPDESEP